MGEDYAALRPLARAADALAEKDDWPRLCVRTAIDRIRSIVDAARLRVGRWWSLVEAAGARFRRRACAWGWRDVIEM